MTEHLRRHKIILTDYSVDAGWENISLNCLFYETAAKIPSNKRRDDVSG